jgi:integrase
LSQLFIGTSGMGYIIRERVGKKGKSYQTLIRHHSRFLKVQETRTFSTKREAVAWAEEFEYKLKHEGAVPKAPTVLTFQDLLTRYRQEVLPYKMPRTQRNERYFLEYWERELGSTILTHLNASQVNTCITSLMKDHKPNTVKRYFSIIHMVLNHALNWELLTIHPLQKLRRPKVPKEEIRFLDAHERFVLLKACKASKNPHLYPYVVLCLDVGLRREECRNLRWRDINLADQTLTVWKRKNEKPLTVPFSDFAFNALWEYKEQQEQLPGFVENYKESQPLFQGKPGKPFSVRRAWEAVIRKIGLEDVHIHTLRHTCSAELLSSGASLAHVKDILGHQDITVTVNFYGHLTQNNLREVIQNKGKGYGYMEM